MRKQVSPVAAILVVLVIVVIAGLLFVRAGRKAQGIETTEGAMRGARRGNGTLSGDQREAMMERSRRLEAGRK